MVGEFNIEIEYRHVPRLDSGSEESSRYLDEFGYVVIKNVLTAEEAKKTSPKKINKPLEKKKVEKTKKAMINEKKKSVISKQK